MSRRSDSRAAALLGLPPRERRKLLARMGEPQRHALRHYWQLWAHDGQLPPDGDWLAWLILAGRGFGKTRAGAEWVRAIAESDGTARIALVGASLGEVRRVMVEGASGLLAIAPRGKRPKFEPSRRLLRWPGGAQAMLYSAGEPDSLRGPQHSHACGAGPEGTVCKRKSRPARWPGSLPGGRHRANPARRAGRWRVLVDRHHAQR